MTTRLFAALTAVLVLACAGQTAATKTDQKNQTAQLDKIPISNLSPFDLAVCHPRKLDLPALSAESIIGVLLSGQPAFLECLTDAKTRGEAKETRVSVKVSVTDSGVSYDASGDNLLPDGKACIEEAAKKLPLAPLPKGAAALAGQIGFLHSGATSPTVRFGINTASDVVGTIRLAQPSWCDCYADYASAAPPQLTASLRFSPPKTGAPPKSSCKEGTVACGDTCIAANEPCKLEGGLAAKVETSADPGAQKVAACLQAKLETATLPVVDGELQVPYAFLLLNSFAPAMSPDAKPGFQFLQLEAIRSQRNADVAIALGGRGVAAAAYDAIVAKYKAKPAPALIKELRVKCAAVLSNDDKWLGSLKSLLDTDRQVATLVATLKSGDPQWNAVDTEAQKRITTVAGDIATAEKQKAVDVGACPKDRN